MLLVKNKMYLWGPFSYKLMSDTFNESGSLLFPRTLLMHSVKYLIVNPVLPEIFREISSLVELF